MAAQSNEPEAETVWVETDVEQVLTGLQVSLVPVEHAVAVAGSCMTAIA